MSTVFSDTVNLQGLFQHTKFLTGQDSLDIKDFTRLVNYALDEYSYLALTSDGRWQFDDTTHVNSNNNPTYSRATATLNGGAESIPLETNFIMINQVQIMADGRFQVVHPIDTRDSKDWVLDTRFRVDGRPKFYDYDDHALFFYPKSDTSRTVKILYSRASPYFDVTDTTAPIGIPRIHHEYLALYAAHKLTFRTNDPNRTQFKQELLEMEAKIRDWYSKRDEDTPRRLRAMIPGTFRGRNRRGSRIKSRDYYYNN